MFSKVMLFVISYFVIGVVVAGFVFSQGVATNSIPTTQPTTSAWHNADQIWCDGCVNTANLKDSSVTGTKITDGTVSGVDVDQNEICVKSGSTFSSACPSSGGSPGGSSTFSCSTQSSTSAVSSLVCISGIRTGGGCLCNSGSVKFSRPLTSQQGWECSCNNPSSSDRVYVVCCS